MNSLLRIDNARGESPLPFERPKAPMNFWVLQLPDGRDSVRKWTSRVARLLRKHAKLLRQLRRKRAAFTLFIETEGAPEPLRLDVKFLKLLTELEISLEHFHS